LDQGDEQGSVGTVEARPRVGSAEYGDLVAENEELDVLADDARPSSVGRLSSRLKIR
jgi:hypothetical protein